MSEKKNNKIKLKYLVTVSEKQTKSMEDLTSGSSEGN